MVAAQINDRDANLATKAIILQKLGISDRIIADCRQLDLGFATFCLRWLGIPQVLSFWHSLAESVFVERCGAFADLGILFSPILYSSCLLSCHLVELAQFTPICATLSHCWADSWFAWSR